MSLVKWVGSFDFNKVICVFVNTGPVDSWLALFCSLSYQNPEVYQNFIRKNLGIYCSIGIETEMSIRN